MINEYWGGSKHAFLKKEDVQADWINKSMGEQGLKATNKAFCIWYHGQQTLYETGSPKEMREAMRECGMAGWGLGVTDLREAFEHISKNNGKWTDNNAGVGTSYSGKSGAWDANSAGKYIRGDSIPDSIKNFLSEVDKSFPKLKDAMTKFQEACLALQNVNLKPEAPQSAFETAKKHIDKIKNVSKQVSRYMWLAPPTVSMALPATESGYSKLAKVEGFAGAAPAKIDTTLKFVDGIDKIESSLKMYVEASQAFGDKRVGAAFTAMSLALGYVPVLGGFYGEIVKRIPGLAVHWRDFMLDYTNMSLRIKEDPPKWKCNICGSM